MVKSGEETMNSAAEIIAEREWPNHERLLRKPASQAALAQQIRKGISGLQRHANNQHLRK
jgi:hypothetical protein